MTDKEGMLLWLSFVSGMAVMCIVYSVLATYLFKDCICPRKQNNLPTTDDKNDI